MRGRCVLLVAAGEAAGARVWIRRRLAWRLGEEGSHARAVQRHVASTLRTEHVPVPSPSHRVGLDHVSVMAAVGFKKLIKDAALELKVYNIDQMARLFNLKGGAKVSG